MQVITIPDAQFSSPRPRGEDRVYKVLAAIRGQILSGALSPLQRLIETDLVERFGANRVIIRTAIYLLEYEGLVEREQNRGARVRRIDPAEAREIAEARAAIETILARHAAGRATPADIAAMRAVLADMEAAHEAEDLFAMSRHNTRLHETIHAAARNETLRAIVANLKHRLVNVQFSTMMMPGRAARSMQEHGVLVDAIASGNGERAETAMREHMAQVRDNLERSFAGLSLRET